MAADAPADGLAPMPPGHGETVLIAEDDDQVRELTRGVLESAGYRVIEARDGEEAVEIVESRFAEIDLFLLDAIMPRMTGREVHGAIARCLPGARVLFVTGHSFDTLDEMSLPEQGYELLYKPLSANELLQKLRAMLDA